MEKLDIKSRSSQAKTVGTIVSITGAIIVTLYKGQPLIVTPSHSLLSTQSNWLIGGVLLAADWLLMAVWNIVMAAIVKDFPAELTIAFFYCFFVAILSALFTLVAVKDLNVWKLRSNIELITIAIFGSIVSTNIHAWCLRIKGPIYVSIFKPFGIVIAVIMSVILLAETLYIGSVIGSIVISIGFYAVIWGKSTEEKVIEDIDITSFKSSPHAPLLVN
ncbi:Wat1-related protein, partial [Thalictrum thalictroides]